MAIDYKQKLGLVENFIGEIPYDFAVANYSVEYADVLKGKLSNHLETILISCVHNMDKRTPLGYGQDLLLGWIIEDYILNLIKTDNSTVIKKNGADAKREFLTNKMVSTDSDYLVIVKEKQIFLELIVDYTTFWYKNQKCHLRDNKLEKLVKHSKVADTYLLAVDVVNKKYILIRIFEAMSCKKIDSHIAYGGKPAYEIYLSKDKFKDITELNIKMLEA